MDKDDEVPEENKMLVQKTYGCSLMEGVGLAGLKEVTIGPLLKKNQFRVALENLHFISNFSISKTFPFQYWIK